MTVRDRMRLLVVLGMLVAGGCAGLGQSGSGVPRYAQVGRILPGTEWRFTPVVTDLNGDGHLDLAATARVRSPSLRMWLGDGSGGFTPLTGTWTHIGYGPITYGDINRDGRPDLVVASHFARVQTLVNDGRGGFIDTVLTREDGYAGAQLADLDRDGRPELILLGYSKAGVEIYRGDGAGKWTLSRVLPDKRPSVLIGRSLAIADLNHDGHLDIVAAFQQAGVHVFLGDGRGGFTGGRGEFSSSTGEFEAVAVGDVNKDGHMDIVINGASGAPGQLEGPDVYLGDGRGGWKPSSGGLKVLKAGMGGLALGDLDGDGNLDIVAGGLRRGGGEGEEGYGVFWFRGDGQGGWRPVKESGLPDRGLSVIEGIALGDLDRDGRPEVVVTSGMYPSGGSITIWKQR